MKAPICQFCLESEILCSKDQARLDASQITKLDIEVSRQLYKSGRAVHTLESVELFRTEELGDTVLAIVESQRPLAIDEVEKINRNASAGLHRDLKLIELKAPQNKILQELVLPKRVVSHSSLWLPDGSRYIRLRLSEGDGTPKPSFLSKLNQLSKGLLDSEVVIE